MRLAVHVTAHFFDQVVEETISPRGRHLVLGGSGAMALPVPQGRPYLARLSWQDGNKVVVEDADGRATLLEGDDVVDIREGPVRLELRLVRRFRLRRMASTATIVSSLTGMALLFIVLQGIGLTLQSSYTAAQVYCETWLVQRVYVPGICPEQGGGTGGAGGAASGDRLAEYLERILKDDLDGEDVGTIAMGDRQHGDKPISEREIYMPAGDKGPPDKMGGAENTDMRPVRTPPVPKEPVPQVKKRSRQELLASENGTPVDLPDLSPEPDEDEADDAQAQVEEIPPEDLAEDVKGWGVRDWYDQEARERDEREIDLMKSVANRVLRIDPNDPDALSVLAYYQYLSEDHQAAIDTYDRYIEVDPESAAGYNNKALIYKRLGEYGTEENLYRIALTLAPDDVTALNNLAVNLSHQGRHDEALAIMKRLEALDPGDPYAELHRAKIHAQMGNDDLALHHLELALQGMKELDTLHHIEFRQDIRVDPSFAHLRTTSRFRSLLWRYYGEDTPLPEE